MELASKAAYSPSIFDGNRPEIDGDLPVHKEQADLFFSNSDAEAVKDGKKALTVCYAFAYPDASLKPHQYWLLVYVATFKGSLTDYSVSRNRPALKEAPK